VNEFKGTPGPWFTDGDGIVRVKSDAGIMSDPPIKVGSGWREDCWCDEDANDESKANARLIAAAPDLLEALILMSAPAATLPEYRSKHIMKAMAAIAKALQP